MEGIYKRSRILYIIEATLEYLISIFFANELLPELANALDIPDGTTGIISSIISLGCVFQLIAIFFRRSQVKPIVLTFSILNQVIFTLLYLIPMINATTELKISIFAVGILLAYLLYYIAHPHKINWFMSLIDENKRGKFTSKKEIISLVTGMGFSFLMSLVLDSLKSQGRIEAAFVVFAITIFILMIMHSLSMIFSVEKKTIVPKQSMKDALTVFRSRGVVLVAFVFVLWNISTYSTKPFLGVYMLNTLGLDAWFRVGFLPMIMAISRIISSILLGIYADRKSFSKMISICFGISAISFLVISLSSPKYGASNGYIMMSLHYILYGAAMGGINSSLINLCYDYAPLEKRVGALAITQAVSGVVGFLSATLSGVLVNYIQTTGLTLFGTEIYAQQVVSIIGTLFSCLAGLFVILFLVRKTQKSNTPSPKR